MVLSPFMTPVSNPIVTMRCGLGCAALLAGLFLFAHQPLRGQAAPVPSLSPTELKIRDYIRAHQAEQVAFLEKAVNISSGTFNLPGVRAAGRLFEPEFSSLGFEAKWIALPDAVGRAGHLFAERKGNRASGCC